MSKSRLLGAVLLALLGAFACSASARAGELYIYEHNGSVMDWFMTGHTVRVTYSVPRPGLQDAGVREGTIMFEGTVDGGRGGRYEGTAYAFKAGCRPAAYRVIGYDEGPDRIVLRGPAPVRDREGCAVTGYSATSPHARLIFIYSATHH